MYKNQNNSESLQLGRDLIGKTIKISTRNGEVTTKIKDVITCPYNHPARFMWLNAFKFLKNYSGALENVIEYYQHDNQSMGLRVTYVMEANSKSPYSREFPILAVKEDFILLEEN